MKNKNILLICPIILLGLAFLFATGCKKKADNNNNPTPANTVTDIDGNIYHVVTIGTQVWMVENLKTTKYRDGTSIPNVTGNSSWSSLITGAYCDYNNNSSNSTTYGRMYNWYAINDAHNICPAGWHIPTDAEWTTLTNYLGGETVAGAKLKETGTAHWTSPNVDATNENGFTALPGGTRWVDGVFGLSGTEGRWWTSTEYNAQNAWWRMLNNTSGSVVRTNNLKTYGFSVRCIKD